MRRVWWAARDVMQAVCRNCVMNICTAMATYSTAKSSIMDSILASSAVLKLLRTFPKMISEAGWLAPEMTAVRMPTRQHHLSLESAVRSTSSSLPGGASSALSSSSSFTSLSKPFDPPPRGENSALPSCARFILFGSFDFTSSSASWYMSCMRIPSSPSLFISTLSKTDISIGFDVPRAGGVPGDIRCDECKQKTRCAVELWLGFVVPSECGLQRCPGR
mmetsp:Transcript_2564/g.5954  ORF Transcript_2564/g.5954 Transcript_2564/m.5954 type:complete len:219 (+) Transcript_2564:114-770(+)